MGLSQLERLECILPNENLHHGFCQSCSWVSLIQLIFSVGEFLPFCGLLNLASSPGRYTLLLSSRNPPSLGFSHPQTFKSSPNPSSLLLGGMNRHTPGVWVSRPFSTPKSQPSCSPPRRYLCARGIQNCKFKSAHLSESSVSLTNGLKLGDSFFI